MDKKSQAELIKELAEILEQLDWILAIPTDDDVCRGLIVGEQEFVLDVTKCYYGEDAEIIMPNNENPEKEQEINLTLHPEKKIVH